MTPNDQALLDSRIAQSEAKTDGKFAELRGDLKVVSQGLTALKDRFDDLAARLTSAPVDLAIVKTKVEHLPGKGFVVTAAVGSVTALTAILIMLQKLGVLH